MLKPLKDRIIAEIVKEEKTVSGIILAENAQKKSQIAKVIAVGPGKLNENNQIIPMELKIGQKIVFEQYASTEIEIEGKKYLIIKETDVLAVLS